MAKIRESRRKAEARTGKTAGDNQVARRPGHDVSPFERDILRKIHSKEFRSKGHNLQRELSGLSTDF
jgi:hypothetical protein